MAEQGVSRAVLCWLEMKHHDVYEQDDEYPEKKTKSMKHPSLDFGTSPPTPSQTFSPLHIHYAGN